MVRMITLKQAAAETGLTENALRAGAIAGTLPATRAGTSGRGKIIFEADELEKALIQMVRSNIRTDEPQSEAIPETAAKGGYEGEVIPFTVFKNVK